jgi:hypothetical protein
MNEQEQEYRRYAEQAREMAAMMRRADDRQFWLNLAVQWDLLAEDAARGASLGSDDDWD